jgi:hypothetical protein
MGGASSGGGLALTLTPPDTHAYCIYWPQKGTVTVERNIVDTRDAAERENDDTSKRDAGTRKWEEVRVAREICGKENTGDDNRES